jgi:3',5'-cyclic AMP phosphodiesterase CpdA
MAVETLILRFRDLVTDPSETIASHGAIIDAAGHTWWAWWNKLGEKVPTEVSSELNGRMGKDGPLAIYLMDSGQELLYEARCAEIHWPLDLGREPSPDPDKTPEYYRNRSYQAWFKLTAIAREPVAEPATVLNALTYVRVDDFFTSGESKYGVFYGKRIYSPSELRQQDRTIWFVREAKATDPHHEIALVNARMTMPRDFVTDPVATRSHTFLWLSDAHFDAAGEHHTFALAPEHGVRMLGPALEEDVQAAGVAQLGGVIASGDLTWRATDEDYAHVKAMMRNIQSWSRLDDPASFVVCPGNHDLAFSADPARKDQPVTVTASEARAAYERFYSDFFQRGPNEFLAMGRRYLVGDSRIVDIVALNTSLLQQHHEIFQGQGFVGDAQLTHVASEMGWNPENVEDRAYRVMVLHHHVMPVVYREVPEHGRQYSLLLDAGAVMRWAVTHRIDLILHGHMHQPYCGLITLPLHSTGQLADTHTTGLAALASTGVGAEHRGEIGQNLFGLLDFAPDGVRVRMYQVGRTTPLNVADTPFLERKFPYGARV